MALIKLFSICGGVLHFFSSFPPQGVSGSPTHSQASRSTPDPETDSESELTYKQKVSLILSLALHSFQHCRGTFHRMMA